MVKPKPRATTAYFSCALSNAVREKIAPPDHSQLFLNKTLTKWSDPYYHRYHTEHLQYNLNVFRQSYLAKLNLGLFDPRSLTHLLEIIANFPSTTDLSDSRVVLMKVQQNHLTPWSKINPAISTNDNEGFVQRHNNHKLFAIRAWVYVPTNRTKIKSYCTH